jgi:hypothetical protein
VLDRVYRAVAWERVDQISYNVLKRKLKGELHMKDRKIELCSILKYRKRKPEYASHLFVPPSYTQCGLEQYEGSTGYLVQNPPARL